MRPYEWVTPDGDPMVVLMGKPEAACFRSRG